MCAKSRPIKCVDWNVVFFYLKNTAHRWARSGGSHHGGPRRQLRAPEEGSPQGLSWGTGAQKPSVHLIVSRHYPFGSSQSPAFPAAAGFPLPPPPIPSPGSHRSPCEMSMSFLGRGGLDPLSPEFVKKGRGPLWAAFATRGDRSPVATTSIVDMAGACRGRGSGNFIHTFINLR